MLPPFALKLIGVAAALAIVAAGAYYEGHHHEALAFDAYKVQQAELAQKQVTTNHDAVAAVAASEADGLRAISAHQQEQINEVQKRNDALVASNADLARRLRGYLTRTGGQPASVPAAASGGPVDHDAGDAALSVGLQQFTGWLTGQFYEADRIAVRLTAAQQVIVQDRQVCNGSLPGVTGTN
jgi:inactivated superfamily I helicase